MPYLFLSNTCNDCQQMITESIYKAHDSNFCSELCRNNYIDKKSKTTLRKKYTNTININNNINTNSNTNNNTNTTTNNNTNNNNCSVIYEIYNNLTVNDYIMILLSIFKNKNIRFDVSNKSCLFMV